MLSDNPHSGIYAADTARTLDGNGGRCDCQQGGITVVTYFMTVGGYPDVSKEQAGTLMARVDGKIILPEGIQMLKMHG